MNFNVRKIQFLVNIQCICGFVENNATRYTERNMEHVIWGWGDKVERGLFAPWALCGTEGVGRPGTTRMEWKVFQLPQGFGFSSKMSF
jgi:hypothetical protein